MKRLLGLYILALANLCTITALPEVIRIGDMFLYTRHTGGVHKYFYFAGGLFHPADDKQEIAFRNAVEKINSDRTILPRSKLSAQIERISPQDSFHASKRGKFRKYFKKKHFLDAFFSSMPSFEKRRCCHFWPTVGPYCQSCPVHLRYYGNPSLGNKVGLPTEAGELSCQPVPTPDHPVKSTYYFEHTSNPH